jgi:Na+/phosphate symporter
MKNLLYGTLFLALVGITFVGCEKADTYSVDSSKRLTPDNFKKHIESVEMNFDENFAFIDDFLTKAKTNSLDKKSFEKMLVMLNIDSSINVDELDNYNLENGVYDSIELYKNRVRGKKKKKSRCDRLVEIRDALLQECSKYVIGIDESCAAAVMIAYWYKSRNC